MGGAVLLSRTEAKSPIDRRVFSDLGTALSAVVLSGGTAPDEIAGGRAVNLMRSLERPDIWAHADCILLGPSVIGEIAPVLVAGLAGAIDAVADRKPSFYTSGASGESIAFAVDALGLRLGRWLVEWVRLAAAATPGSAAAPTAEELGYFVGSGGYRAWALTNALQRNFVGSTFPSVVDVGAGIGLISYLLSGIDALGSRRVLLVEPLGRYRDCAAALWQTSVERRSMSFTQAAAEAYSPDQPLDLALHCQCLYRVAAAERAAVIAKAWAALNRGGVVVVNELVRDDDSRPDGAAPPLTRRELLCLFEGTAAPRAYLQRDTWSVGRDPCGLDAAAYGSDTFLIAQKP